MEIGPGPGFEAEDQPRTMDFTVSAMGLVSRTFSLWVRQIIPYMIIAGITILVFQFVSFAILWIIWGDAASLLAIYVSTDPISFVMNIWSLSLDLSLPPAEMSLLIGILLEIILIYRPQGLLGEEKKVSKVLD